MHPTIMYSNVRSVLNKLDEIPHIVSSNRNLIHIVAISESWLTDDIQDCVLAFPDYTTIRCDRTSRRGGGVCIWCHISVKFERSILVLSTSNTQTL